MSAYGSLFSARFRMLLQYRAAAIAGFGTQLFWGLLRVMIYDAFFRSTTVSQPMTYRETVTYIWLGQALIYMTLRFVDPDVRSMIRSGSVAYEMVRPLDLYSLWYSRALAGAFAPTLLRAALMFPVAGLFFGLQAPPSLASAAGFLLTVMGALLLSAAFATLLTTSLLWTVAGDGLARLGPFLVFALSGMLIPLPFLPNGVQPVVNALPFRDMIDVPFRVYMGNIPPSQLGAVLTHQLVWWMILVVCGRFLLAQGTRRLVVQGG